MTIIHQDDIVQSVQEALQFISYYHPLDFIQAVGRAWEKEQSPAARDALAQILMNSRMSAEGHRPVCQDTGMVVAFIEVGMGVRWSSELSLEEMIHEGVRRAYTDPDNTLRASMVSPPWGARRNTGDNTPAIVHTRIVPGNRIKIGLAAKGGGSENKAKFTVLNPSDNLVDWVLETVPGMGAGWCPPGMLGLGIGGSSEKAMLLAKEALMEPVNIHELLEKGPDSPLEELRLELFEKVNALGIGAQGLGGLTTVVDVKILDYPTHAASLPVALIPNCAATRHIEFTLDGSGPAEFTPPTPDDYPPVTWQASPDATRVNLDTITPEEVRNWQPGQRLLLTGHILTGRDAAHRRIQELLEKGHPLPQGVDFHNRFIYYVGPVDPVDGEVMGPAGPTTATRMDKFTEMMLGQLGLLGMIGKAERGPQAIESIRKHQATYLVAVGGAAYLVSKAIRKARVVAFEDLGMEAIYEFEVENMPVTVAVDSQGASVHQSGPAKWRITDNIESMGKTP
ncbi:fumarate hydratase [Thiolapillus brandeum]|uniref:Fumarate hydratase class I n=1 Tax=Thiolapillus brandeum TaxID=1076588 RepID=A0A7U6JHJ2_9GAMM|nr:fumarate hydratase [Thiolapillus brandeum]BAO44529.1 fumarate hydratase class I [Thiolapillus brandeum]